MRRILRKILAGEADQLGDISTVSPLSFWRLCMHQLTIHKQLSDPSVVEKIIQIVRENQKK